jgi:hypothetical protein
VPVAAGKRVTQLLELLNGFNPLLVDILLGMACAHTSWIQKCLLTTSGLKAKSAALLATAGESRAMRRELFPNGRCRNHGGLCTGPKTPEGMLRTLVTTALADLVD